MENKLMYQRRLRGKKLVDFHTKISSLPSSGVRQNHDKGFSSEKELGSSKREETKRDHIVIKEVPEDPYSRPKRKYKPKYDPNEWEVASTDFRSCRKTRTATASLRGKLNDSLFDHCFRNIWKESSEEKRNPCTFLSCYWFYMYTIEQYREKVLGWIKKTNIFSKQYVFVPIVLWSHWSLLIFCNFGKSSPCMLLLDSFHKLGPLRLESLIRRLVLDIYETEERPEKYDFIQSIPLLVPKVPQQRNGKECGVFVLYYIHLFLESAPESFSISSGYPYFMKQDWFTEKELEEFYDRLEFLGLESSDSEE